MAGYFVLATILLICAGNIPEEMGAQLPLALLGRMSIVGYVFTLYNCQSGNSVHGLNRSFSIIYVWAAELFPTAIRNNGFGLLSLAFMIGGMVAPEVIQMV